MAKQPERASHSEQATADLLVIHAEYWAAHFSEDAMALDSRCADPSIYVRDGVLAVIPRATVEQSHREDLHETTEHEWDDLGASVIRVSEDVSLGWVITRTKVRRSPLNGSVASAERGFINAGIKTHEKWE